MALLSWFIAFQIAFVTGSSPIFHIVDVFQLLKDVVIRLNKEESFENFLRDTLDDLNAELDELAESIENVETNIIVKLLKSYPALELSRICTSQMEIGVFYSKLKNYINKWASLDKSIRNDFCHYLVSHSPNSLKYIYEQMNVNLLSPQVEIANFGTLTKLQLLTKKNYTDMMHNFQQSPQQIIKDFYKSIALTQIKAYVLIHFAYRALEEFEGSKFKAVREIFEGEYKSSINLLSKKMTSLLQSVSTELWKGDPDVYVKGETFLDLVRLSQAVVLGRSTLTQDTCEKVVISDYIECHNDDICKETNCRKVVDCKSIAKQVKTCTSFKNTNRKYYFIKHENEYWGQKTLNCKKLQKLDNSFGYCLCMCTEPGTANLAPEVFINLRPTLSNISEDKVVTGIRFVKKNKIIHLQIQEGKLLTQGKIKGTNWVPVDNYKITDRNIKANKDYRVIKWNSSAVDLDDIIAEPGKVVIGVCFSVYKNRLKLKVILAPFDYQFGKIIRETNSTKIGQDLNRDELTLDHPEIPVLSIKPSEPDSRPNQYIRFQPSDLKKDLAQTTVPYFDSQPVESKVPAPLQGIGLFHKGQKGYGGFITLKIITYNVSYHLEPEYFPESN